MRPLGRNHPSRDLILTLCYPLAALETKLDAALDAAWEA